MFLTEQQIWAIPQTPEGKADFDKLKRKIARDEHKAKQGLTSDFTPIFRNDQSVSNTPDCGNSAYSFNDTFIELRTPFDEMRGGITFGAACGLGPMFFGLYVLFSGVLGLFDGKASDGEKLGYDAYFFISLTLLIVVSAISTILYFGWRYLRLESFVQRRLLVRFNRKTRKVYIHRPAFAGGIIELPWDEIRPDGIHPGGNEEAGMGAPLMLMWLPQHTPHKEIEFVLVGRLARRNSDITNLWEFIRRYMEEGPQAVPRPKLIGKFPWPWKGIQSALGLVWPLWRIGSLRWMLPLVLLISPAMLLFGAGQWLSLMLCWEPVWPRTIREACGEGWGSVLHAKLIDIGAWILPLGAIWWVMVR